MRPLLAPSLPCTSSILLLWGGLADPQHETLPPFPGPGHPRNEARPEFPSRICSAALPLPPPRGHFKGSRVSPTEHEPQRRKASASTPPVPRPPERTSPVEDHAGPAASQGFVGSGGHHVAVLKGGGHHASRHQPADVRHVGQEIRPVVVRDLPQASVVQVSGVAAGS